MTPTEALTLQAQRPQVPSGWGGSFEAPVFLPQPKIEPCGPTTTSHPAPNELTGRLLAELTRVADRRETLPTPCLTTLARRIGVPIDERAAGTMSRALQALVERGHIAHWIGGVRGPHHGQRIITLLASGREIRTPGAPSTVTLG